ncbi:potassium channel family protein [Citreimonas sp.]|uniref:potassium channel family protein n=1 Tax=Citreimonas sp. TaxID=3036715 RepID=UPI004058891F
MRVVILGASRFGEAIADTLIDAKHEVVLIDRDRERLEELAERMDCGMIEGDGTLPTILEEAYRDDNDTFIAVTNASEQNILAALVARSIGYARVIPQILTRELMRVCRQLDLRDVINPHATVAQSILEALQDQVALDHETELQNQLRLKRVHIPENCEGKTLASLDLPPSARAIARIRGDDECLVDDDTELAHGDYVLIALSCDDLDELDKAFDKSSEGDEA